MSEMTAPLTHTEVQGESRGAHPVFCAALWAAALLGGALRLWMAWCDQGVFWPDEIFQSLEPAHRLVFGYGLQAWEFLHGARGWLFPGFIAAVLAMERELGLDRPEWYLPSIKTLFVLANLGVTVGVYHLARLSAGTIAAAGAAAAYWLYVPAIYFSPRALSENAAALPLTFGLLLLLRPRPSAAAAWGGGLLLGLAFALRPQILPLFVVLPLLLIWRRRAGEAARGFAGAALMVLLYGALDRLTWGKWFQSLWANYQVSIGQNLAAQISTAPWYDYGRTFFRCGGAWAAALLALALSGSARGPILALSGLIFVALYSSLGHKEYRFLLPFFPLFFALVGGGLQSLLACAGKRRPGWIAAGFVALGLLSAASFRSLTFGQLGHPKAVASDTAFDFFGPLNRLLIVAGRQPDLCGLGVDGFYRHLTGGYTYLHRAVPLYGGVLPPPERHFYNYRITLQAPAGGEKIVAVEGPFRLLRRPFSRCAADADFRTGLF